MLAGSAAVLSSFMIAFLIFIGALIGVGVAIIAVNNNVEQEFITIMPHMREEAKGLSLHLGSAVNHVDMQYDKKLRSMVSQQYSVITPWHSCSMNEITK